jgi:hypothetical protein
MEGCHVAVASSVEWSRARGARGEQALPACGAFLRFGRHAEGPDEADAGDGS